MPFLPGDPVHVAGLGKGTVREVRNGDQYLVDVKGRALVASGSQLTLHEDRGKPARVKSAAVRSPPHEYGGNRPEPPALDLHGRTVVEALEILGEFLNRALLDGSAEVRIIHGRSGGKIKAAVHAQLRGMSSIRRFRLDPRNPGVTIVEL